MTGRKPSRLPTLLIGTLLLGCGPTAPSETVDEGPPHPNIVLILADDMGFGDPGAYNPESKIPTPHMDRLAAEGRIFTDAHSPSSVCTPTRYSILTGRYAWRTRLKSGVLWGYSRSLLEPGRLTLASLLRDHGYATGAVGKWHLGFQPFDPALPEEEQRVDYDRPLRPGPLESGFDYFFGIPASLDMEPYVYVENERPVEPATERIEASRHRRQGGGGFWREGPIAPGFRHEEVLDVLTEKAVEFVARHVAEGRDAPFFLYFPLTAPHTPWLPTEPFQGKSGAGYYGDFTHQVDWTIGLILAVLDEKDLAGDTLVLVSSDNGAHWLEDDIGTFGHRANGPFRGQKADIHEGGHRVPLIARWPGRIPAGTESDHPVCLTDLVATVAELLGFELPGDAAEDSFSFLAALEGRPGSEAPRPFLMHHSLHGMFAVREGPWKLIEGLGSGGFTRPASVEPGPGEPAGQLFNLEKDPSEADNLYDAEPLVVKRLQETLDRIRLKGRSRLPLEKGRFTPVENPIAETAAEKSPEFRETVSTAFPN